MNKTVFFAFVATMLAVSAVAQERPSWIDRPPRSKNASYVYDVPSAFGNTEREARNQAFGQELQKVAFRIGTPIDVREINNAVQNGNAFDVISRDLNIPVNIVCEHTERIGSGYRVYILCQAAKAGNIRVQYDEFTKCYDRQYALLKSAVLPGWGQFSKRRYGAGTMIVVGEVASLGAGVVTYFMAQDKLKIMNDSNVSYSDFKVAKESYDNLMTMNTVCWGVAAGIYVFNLIHAGLVKPRINPAFAFRPDVFNANGEMAVGATLTYQF